MSGELAPALWGIPVVADAASRDAAFPLATRIQNQRVFNIATGNIERWSASAWVIDLSGAAGGGAAITAAIATAEAYTDAARPTGNRSVTTLAGYLANNAAINAIDYASPIGTVINTNVNDATASIQAALTDAGLLPSGGEVVLPRGTYKITSQLTIPSNVKLRGEGRDQTILQCTLPNSYAIFATNKANIAVEGIGFQGTLAIGVVFNSSTNVAVRKCSFTGCTSPASGTNYAGGVQVYLCDDVFLEDNLFSGNGYIGVGLSSDIQVNGNGTPADCSKRIKITGNKCLSVAVQTSIGCYDLSWSDISDNLCTGAKTGTGNNNGYGIMTYKTAGEAVGSMRDNRIENNTVLSVGGTGIYVQGGFRTTVVGNAIYDAGLVQSDTVLAVGAVALSDCADCTVSGNTIGAGGKAGIAIGGATTAEGHVVSGNAIDTVTGYGIVIRCALTRSSITGNTVKATTSAGIGTFPSDTGSSGLVISGNTIRTVSLRGIDYYGISRSVVAHNTVIASGGDGIALVGGSQTEVAHNVVFDGGTLATNTYFAIDLVSMLGALVTGNSVGNTGGVGFSTGLYVPSTNTKAVVVGNRAEGCLTANYNVDATTAAGIRFAGNFDAGVALSQSFPVRQQAVLEGASASITQLLLGDAALQGAVGTRWSGGDTFLAQNASHTLGSDLWHQSTGASASKLLILRLNGDLEFYSAVAGTADATFATFWGTAKAVFTAASAVKLAGTQVLSTRVTGYTAMTGSPDKATAYATSTVTLAQLAGRVAQLQADLTTHGVIGA